MKKRQIYLVNERRELEKIAFESNENYISKQVIRDKIDELEEELKEYDLKEYCLYEDTIQERIKIYKELLGE